MKRSALLLALTVLLGSCGTKNAVTKDNLAAALPQEASPACGPVQTLLTDAYDEGSYDLEMFKDTLQGRAASAGLLSVTDSTSQGPSGSYPVKIVKHTSLYRDVLAKINGGALCYGTLGKPVLESFEAGQDGQTATGQVTRSLDREAWATDPVLGALGVEVPATTTAYTFQRDGDTWKATPAQQ